MRIEILEQEVRELRMLVEDLLEELRDEPPYEEEPDSPVFTLPVLASVPLLRQTFAIGLGTSIRVGLERPDSDLCYDAGQNGLESAPDLTLVGRTEGEWGHVQAGGGRQVGFRTACAGGETETGYLMSASGLLIILKRDHFVFGGTWGRGSSRFMNDINGLGYDGVIRPDGSLRLIDHYSGYMAYTHRWSHKFRSNITAGGLWLNDTGLLTGEDFRNSPYGAMNLIWSPNPADSIDIEGLYGQLERQERKSEDSARLQATIKHDFVK